MGHALLLVVRGSLDGAALPAAKRPARGAYRATAHVLRITAIGLLLIMLAQWAFAVRITGPPGIALVIDRSASMSIADQYDDAALNTSLKNGSSQMASKRADAAQSCANCCSPKKTASC